jgi:hypothetical protein
MDRPELPAPYFWKTDTTIDVTRVGGGTENVAWYWGPNSIANDGRGKWECYSAPVGINDSYRTNVDTEDEAVAIIISFALLGITKE